MKWIKASEVIPPMTDPMGKHWEQPLPEAIEVMGSNCKMDKATFDALKEYSATDPSGVYEGKMWKATMGGKWYLRWWGKSHTPNRCTSNQLEIVLDESPSPQEQGWQPFDKNNPKTFPPIGDNYNVVWDLEDNDFPVTTTMEWDAINKRWRDLMGVPEIDNVVLYYQPLPAPPTK